MISRFLNRRKFYRKKHFDLVYNHFDLDLGEADKDELKQFFKTIKKNNDHKYYEKWLSEIIPEWPLKSTKRKFLSGGKGRSNINVYRKIRIKNKWLFEKVFFTSNISLKHIKWLEEYVFSVLTTENMVVPRIYQTYESKLLEVVYFDFLELNSIRNPKLLIEICVILYEFSENQEDYLDEQNIPTSLFSFRPPSYTAGIEKLTAAQNELEISVYNILETINNSKRILAHGDIKRTNAFQNKIVIDWDLAGFYPIGFDPAYVLFKLCHNKMIDIKTLDYRQWVEKHFKPVIKYEDWLEFRRNFSFIFLCFFYSRFEDEYSAAIEKEIIEDVRNSFSYISE